MATIRLLKRRIKAAKNISQITKAMEMVAASKMKKAQEKAVSGKPYSQKILELTKDLVSRIKVNPQDFPLLEENNLAEKDLVIVVSTNKGLCGGLNTALFRQINSWFKDNQKTDFVSFGLKAKNFLLRTGRNLIADFSQEQFLENIGALTELIVSGFAKEKKYRQVFLVYNNFVSILSYLPTKFLLLPIKEIYPSEPETEGKKYQFLIEPEIKSVLNNLLPHYLEVLLRMAIIEAEASEHSARMMAMKSATDNACALMADLTLEYNKVRQQLITYEIADIITAKEAMI